MTRAETADAFDMLDQLCRAPGKRHGLARRMGWSLQRVWTALETLEARGMAEQLSDGSWHPVGDDDDDE